MLTWFGKMKCFAFPVSLILFWVVPKQLGNPIITASHLLEVYTICLLISLTEQQVHTRFLVYDQVGLDPVRGYPPHLPLHL